MPPTNLAPGAALTSAGHSPRPELWLPYRQPQPQPRLRLFGFPFAGGAASCFHPLRAALPPGVELCAVQLPGRERRLAEPTIRALQEWHEDLRTWRSQGRTPESAARVTPVSVVAGR